VRCRPKLRGRESSLTSLEKGQTILIHGGAGAVGAYAVQLASHAGATVFARQVATMRRTSNPSEPARFYRLSRGAVREGSVEKRSNVVFDLIGDTQKRSSSSSKEGGISSQLPSPYHRKRPRGTMCRA